MKHILLLLFLPPLLFAEERFAIPPYVAISGLLAVLGLFFWGVYEAVKTQKLIYAWALLPFTLLLFWMFFI